MNDLPDRDGRSKGNSNDHQEFFSYILFQNLKQVREYAKKRLNQISPLSLDEIHDKDLRIKDIFEAGRKLNISDRILTLYVLSEPEV